MKEKPHTICKVHDPANNLSHSYGFKLYPCLTTKVEQIYIYLLIAFHILESV